MNKRLWDCCCLFSMLMVSVLICWICLADSAFGTTAKTDVEMAISMQKVARVQMPFVENKGQFREKGIRFSARTFHGAFSVTDRGEMVYSLPRRPDFSDKEPTIGNLQQRRIVTIRETLVGANLNKVTGGTLASTKVNVFKGSDPSAWKRDIPTYTSVSLGEVYPKIDLTLKAYSDNVEKLFYVKPGAEPDTIRISLEGAEKAEIDSKGELHLVTPLGHVTFSKPVAFQEILGKRVPVEISYRIFNAAPQIEGRHDYGFPILGLKAVEPSLSYQPPMVEHGSINYGFSVASYDKEHTLVIDPLLASAFLGGYNDEYGRGLVVDKAGNVYVSLTTTSSDLPLTPSSYSVDPSPDWWNYDYDIFIAKFDSNLTTVLASTYLGGSGWDFAYALSVNDEGEVFVAGHTTSTNFPATPNAYSSINKGANAFVSKLDSNLTTMMGSTFLGGSGEDIVKSITLESTGNIYLTGSTTSPDFPVTAGAYDTSHNGIQDVLVAKLDSDLTTLISATFLGGNGEDIGESMVVDSSGNIFVTGSTTSSGFPSTAGTYDTTYNGGPDVFISKLDPDLTTLLASTFIGREGWEVASGIALDGTGDVYVVGSSGTASNDYPTTPGAYRTVHKSSSDVFVSKLDANLTMLLASTFLGVDSAVGLIVDSVGDILIAGTVNYDSLAVTPQSFDQSYNGQGDAFVAKLNPELTALLSSTYLGTDAIDWLWSFALDLQENVLVAGTTNAPTFPSVPSGYTTNEWRSYSAFISKLDIGFSSDQHPPVLQPIGDQTIYEGQTLQLILSAMDPDGNSLTYSANNLPAGSFLDPVTGIFSWTPSFDQAGVYQNIVFTVTDNGIPPLGDSQTISITVSNVNRPPTLTPVGDQAGKEGELLQFIIAAMDPDGNSLTYSANNLPAGSFLDPVTGIFSWTPSFDQAGVYQNIVFTVTDNGIPPANAVETINISVANVNRPPVMAVIGNKTIPENGLLQFTVTATDPDGDTLAFNSANLPNGAAFDPSSATFTWAPSLDQTGVYPNILFTVTDNGAPPMSTSQAITIAVNVVMLDFDELSGMSPAYPPALIPEESRLSDRYLSTNGVVFSSGAPYVAVHNIGAEEAPTPPNSITGSRPDGWFTNSPEFPITAKFYNPDNPNQKAITNFVSVTGDLLGANVHGQTLFITLKAYGIDGTEIGSVTKQDVGGTVLSLSLPNIHEVRFFGTADWLGVAIDNFAFSPVRKIPVADAGFNVSTFSATQHTVTLEGKCENATGCRWREESVELAPWGTVGTYGECPLVFNNIPYFYSGDHTLTLECRNDQATASDDMILTVDNSSPHIAPVGGGVCEVDTQLILAGQIADFDGEVVNYQWIEANTTLLTGSVTTLYGGTPVNVPNYTYPCAVLGEHLVYLVAGDGVNSPVLSPLTIQVVDTTAPLLLPTADKTILWPANHKMVNVTIQANAKDNSGGIVTLAATVESNEPEDGLGDGDTSPDWSNPVVNQAKGTISLTLRAERSGKGSGRIYTITITATDAVGNYSQVPVNIIVPHDRREK